MEWPRLRESESEDETALPHASPRQMLDTPRSDARARCRPFSHVSSHRDGLSLRTASRNLQRTATRACTLLPLARVLVRR